MFGIVGVQNLPTQRNRGTGILLAPRFQRIDAVLEGTWHEQSLRLPEQSALLESHSTIAHSEVSSCSNYPPPARAKTLDGIGEKRILELLCEDHVGTYVVPFLCRWRSGDWKNVETGERIEAVVIGWRARVDGKRV
jgi:hypothetical protein